MRRDLRTFELAHMSERELWEATRRTAAARERAFVLQTWGGLQAVKDLWTTWLPSAQNAVSPHWTARLMQALSASTPVSYQLPLPTSNTSTPVNVLPPPFFILTPLLVQIQDIIQALTATAALRALVRIPPTTQGNAASTSLVARLWALLRAEVDAGPQRAAGTTLSHLADELLAARGGAASAEEEEQLRAAVKRTLSSEDLVFVLLRTRLAGALGEALGKAPVQLEVPRRIQAGVAVGAKNTKQYEVIEPLRAEERIAIKGFEDETLSAGVREVMGKLRRVVGWVDEVWRDVMTSP
jgi:hypothetical protein